MGEESLIQQSFNEESVLYPAIPTNHFWDNQFSLPGEGVAGEDCGKTKMIISCSNEGCEFPRELIPHDCKSPTFPKATKEMKSALTELNKSIAAHNELAVDYREQYLRMLKDLELAVMKEDRP